MKVSGKTTYNKETECTIISAVTSSEANGSILNFMGSLSCIMLVEASKVLLLRRDNRF